MESQIIDFQIPSREEFIRGYKRFNELMNTRENWGPAYFRALSCVFLNWGNFAGMAHGIYILIKSWNPMFSRFNSKRLIRCIESNQRTICEFKNRNINTLSDEDRDQIKNIFNEFLDALQTDRNKRSPVSVAKALHLIAPNFFPIWDNSIAQAYGCHWQSHSNACEKYIKFCNKMKIMAEEVREYVPEPDDRSLLKRMDEYNHLTYTTT